MRCTRGSSLLHRVMQIPALRSTIRPFRRAFTSYQHLTSPSSSSQPTPLPFLDTASNGGNSSPKRSLRLELSTLRQIRNDADARQKYQCVLLTGRTIVTERLNKIRTAQLKKEKHGNNAPVDPASDVRSCLALYCTTQSPMGVALPTGLPPIRYLSQKEMESICGYVSTPDDAVAMLFRLPSSSSSESIARSPRTPALDVDRLLILDSIADPGNMGTLIRSAMAFGWGHSRNNGEGRGGVVLLAPTCDPFNDKALRSSRGMALDVDLYSFNSEQPLIELIKRRREFEKQNNIAPEQRLRLLVADAQSDGSIPVSSIATQSSSSSRPTSSTSSTPIWLVIGNESRGVRPSLRSIGERVHLPMHAGVESLNAAVAGSILMHQLARPTHQASSQQQQSQ